MSIDSVPQMGLSRQRIGPRRASRRDSREGNPTNPPPMLLVQRRIGELIDSAETEEQFRRQLLLLTRELTNATLVVYLESESGNEPRVVELLDTLNHAVPHATLTRGSNAINSESLGNLQRLAHRALLEDATSIQLNRELENELSIATPVHLGDDHCAILALRLRIGIEPIETFLLVVQLLATSIDARYRKSSLQAADHQSQQLAAIQEITQNLLASGSTEKGIGNLSRKLQELFDCDEAIVQWSSGAAPGNNCIYSSSTGVIDTNGDQGLMLLRARRELAKAESLVSWQEPGDYELTAVPSLQKWAQRHGKNIGTASLAQLESIGSSSRRDHSQGMILLLYSDSQKNQQTDRGMLSVLFDAVAHVLHSLDSHPARNSKIEQWLNWLHSHRITIALGLLSSLALLAIPFPYKVSSKCVVEPKIRRFVAAPFQGVLKQTLALPGEHVSQGALLGIIDGREYRLELSMLDAERAQLTKKLESQRATGDISESQLSQLEIQRIDAKRDILLQRLANLALHSPVDGIVISGDIKKSEGAPIELGQPLFEVAPLDAMLIEVEVPDEDIQHVKIGQHVTIQLDGLSTKEIVGQIESIDPRAELREDRNVFVANVPITNLNGHLRPGMRGYAKVTTDWHPLGWNLLHKAWYKLSLYW